MTIQQAIELAWKYFQQQQFADAESLAKQVLGLDSNSADALQLLGLIAAQTGRITQGVAFLRRSIVIAPHNPTTHYNLGCVCSAAGMQAEAADSLKQAISLAPNLIEAHIMLGNVYLAKGQADDAIAMYRRCLEINPTQVEGYISLGNALRARGELNDAVAAYHKAVSLRPESAEAHYNLGIVLKSQQLLEESKEAFERTIRLQPRNLDAYNNLAVVLQLLGQIEKAEAVLRKALSIHPSWAQTNNNLGKLAHDTGRLDEAINRYQQAIAAAPQWALPHYNKGLTHLLKGEFQKGWPEFEWRRKAVELEIFSQDFQKPQWNGRPLDGKRILIHSEQGFGDAIQFARYIQPLAALGGEVIFQCHPQLRKLFGCLEDIAQVISLGESIPEFDVHCALLSLPLQFRTEFTNLPQLIPYLRAAAWLVEAWRERLAVYRGKRKVGVVWAGRPKPAGRSIPPEMLIPISEISDVALISVQVGESTASPLPVADYSKQIADFSETAALLANLDMLITIDTATAHLAGAIGVPTRLLLPFIPDWRWMLNRSDSPWYPTMRLFRQHVAGDWSEPIRHIMSELSASK